MSEATQSCCDKVPELLEACGCKAVVIVLGSCCDDRCDEGCCGSAAAEE